MKIIVKNKRRAIRKGRAEVGGNTTASNDS
jgi:hypothetical protein